MKFNQPNYYRQLPFVRLLIPFIVGIIIQWYAPVPFHILKVLAAVLAISIAVFQFLPISLKFSFGWLNGIAIMLFMMAAGGLLTFNKDIRSHGKWIGHHYKDSAFFLAHLQEPLVEKAKSFKAEVEVEAIHLNGKWNPVEGKILVYFQKDSLPPNLQYGSQVIIAKPLQPIKNSGNPGAFDYSRFNGFHDIHHQVFLKSNEYVATGNLHHRKGKLWLLEIRQFVIKTIQENISGEKETAVAEALLIGYRDHLDKELVQAYSNTGVVHIIAISGLHLGMIYLLLVLCFKPFKKNKWVKWIKPITIISVLWIFSLAAGGAPSIMRSAVMFSIIVIGEVLNRKSSIYNTLAVSAFFLLFFNPFLLWDVGFQLSYAAVISIVTFMQPIYSMIYIRNKLLDFPWKLTSVTLSAQVLTLPIILYYFHQFPNLFLITNLVVVPVATLVLYGELFVVLFSKFTVVAKFLGTITTSLLAFMNNFIEGMYHLPFAVYDGIQNSLFQTILIYLIFVSCGFWLIRKSKPAFFVGLIAFLFYVSSVSLEGFNISQRQKIIVYNVPQHTAIDLIEGNKYVFTGDQDLTEDGFLKNFHLKPSRILNGVKPAKKLEDLQVVYPFIQVGKKKVLIVDKPFKFQSETKIPVDLIVISKNPKINIGNLVESFNCRQYVFDGSNSLWRIKQWKKDCENYKIPNWSVADLGAFELDAK